MDKNSADFQDGLLDGYAGYTPREFPSEFYSDGYAQGEHNFIEEQEAGRYSDDADAYYYSDVEQGMYDDDPNPYHGDYSEM